MAGVGVLVGVGVRARHHPVPRRLGAPGQHSNRLITCSQCPVKNLGVPGNILGAPLQHIQHQLQHLCLPIWAIS